MSKLWGGRFSGDTDALVHQFNASLSFDRRLYDEDLRGSVAWAQALARAGVLEESELATLVAGLNRVRQEFIDESFVFAPQDEDIHTAIERRLTELVGDVGAKLHTGRSRNDQVATSFRLWVMGAGERLARELVQLQAAMVEQAAGSLAWPMPGFTHLQAAQPVTWGHWLLSHFWPLQRDQERLMQVRHRSASLPLGAAALAGTAYDIDRDFLAEALGFEEVSANSLDAVSDRDFAADFLYWAALLSVHLSRLSEQLIIFSSRQFGFVNLSDAYSTGSSIMPQKKNPDTLELTRGKAGRLIGHLTGLLTTLKGLPSAYDKDLQEDKEPVFDAYDTLMLALPVMTGLVGALNVDRARLAAEVDNSMLATDLADYLVRRGLPFRQAHHAVGRVVQLAESRDVDLAALTVADLEAVSPYFGADALAVLDVQRSLSSRTVKGATAAPALQAQVAEARRKIDSNTRVWEALVRTGRTPADGGLIA